jgi:hypothetical protein
VKWGWKQADDGWSWQFDATWSVVRDGGSNRWYVVRDGRWLLEDHTTAQDAIQAAERRMGCSSQQ